MAESAHFRTGKLAPQIKTTSKSKASESQELDLDMLVEVAYCLEDFLPRGLLPGGFPAWRISFSPRRRPYPDGSPGREDHPPEQIKGPVGRIEEAVCVNYCLCGSYCRAGLSFRHLTRFMHQMELEGVRNTPDRGILDRRGTPDGGQEWDPTNGWFSQIGFPHKQALTNRLLQLPGHAKIPSPLFLHDRRKCRYRCSSFVRSIRPRVWDYDTYSPTARCGTGVYRWILLGGDLVEPSRTARVVPNY